MYYLYPIAFQIFTSISLLIIFIAIINSCLKEDDWFNRTSNLFIFWGGFFISGYFVDIAFQLFDGKSIVLFILMGFINGVIFAFLYMVSLVISNNVKSILILLISAIAFYLLNILIELNLDNSYIYKSNNIENYSTFALIFIITVFVGFSITSNVIRENVFINITLFKKSKRKNRNYRFYNIYDPEKTDKKVVLKLLEDTIVLIENESNLKIDVRKDLTERTKSIIENVKLKKPNWHEILGSIKELIIILGALGSLAGGVIALDQAKTNLKTTENIITATCVNSDIFVKNKINLITQNPTEVSKIEYEAEKFP